MFCCKTLIIRDEVFFEVFQNFRKKFIIYTQKYFLSFKSLLNALKTLYKCMEVRRTGRGVDRSPAIPHQFQIVNYFQCLPNLALNFIQATIQHIFFCDKFIMFNIRYQVMYNFCTSNNF